MKIDLKVNTSGFFVDLSPTPEANLTLAVTAPGLSATGSLGFFKLAATEGTAAGNTQLVGMIALDLSDGASNQLTASNLGTLLGNSTLSASAEADVHMHFTLSFGGSAAFPNLATDFDLTWSLASATLGADASGKIGIDSSVFAHKPDIHFNNVTLDMGTFFSNFLTPIVQKVQAALAPVQPVIDILNKPAPIFNDLHLADINNDGTTTILEVLESFIGIKSPKAVKFIDTVIAANNFINSIPTSGNGNMTLAIGSFEVGGGGDSSDNSDLRGGGANLASADMTSESDQNTDSELSGSSNSNVRSFFTALKVPALQGGTGPDDGGGFQIPILEHPTLIFDLLLGQNVDLFTFDTPTLDFNPSFSFSVAPIEILPFLKVQFTGSADFKAHLSMGYDTAGLQLFKTHAFNALNVTDLLNGFYIVDDPTKTFAQASLTLSVGLGLDIGIASAYVTGGLTGTITFTADDPHQATDGGKFRALDIGNVLLSGNPLALFNINGTISASFDLNAQVIGIPYTYNIATIQIASFAISAGNIPPVPVFGTVDGSGALTLNIGNGDQTIQVTHISTQANGSETVGITSGGVTQDYAGVKSISGTAGNGNDNISVFANSPVLLIGSTGNDIFQVGPNEFATLQGGAGNDFLGAFDGPYTPSTGALVLRGFGGNDTLQAGGGYDSLDGGDNDDVLYGGGATDTLIGGLGNDALYAGQNDGGSVESLTGGGGNDTFVSDNSYDYGGYGGPQRIALSSGTNNVQYDATDTVVGSVGPHDTLISQGVYVYQNGVMLNPPPKRPTTAHVAATTTLNYIGASVLPQVQAGASANDTSNGQTLNSGNVQVLFLQNNAVVQPIEAGTYTVVAYYLGDNTHAVSPLTLGTLVINPATPGVAASNSVVSFDGKQHVGNVTAGGPIGQNLNADLHLSYKNLADNTVSTIPPTAVGIYEILASVDASRDYNAVTSLDTGHTLTITTIFNAPTAVAADPNLFGSLLVDLNGDNKLDLVVEDVTSSAQSLNVYLGNGNGTFQAKKTTTIPFTNGKILELSNFGLQHFAVPLDLNGDNKTDLLVAAVPYGGTSTGNQNGFYLINGNGDGTFQTPTTEHASNTFALALGHFLTGNNNPGFIYGSYGDSHNSAFGNTVTLVAGLGGGLFSSALDLTVGTAPRGVTTGDFNGDGVSDIVVSDTGGTAVILSHGDGSFGAETYFSSTYTTRIEVADLNKDGKQDVLLGDLGGITAYLGNGNGTFQSPRVVLNNPVGSTVSPIIVGDYNGDGTPDIATLTTPGLTATSFQVLYGNGDGSFAPALNYPVQTTVLLAGDLNGDGVSDIVQLDGGGDVNVLLNLAPKVPATITAASATFTYNGQPHGVVATATGLSNLDLTALLTVSYKNTVTNVVSSSPPTAGGTYAVLASFAGNTRYNAVPTFDTGKRLVIAPASPTLSFTSVSVPSDGSPHEPIFSAIGASGESLNPLLQLQYQNIADGSISLTPPGVVGTYKVFATFQGNANYAYVPLFDTGRTVTVTRPRPTPPSSTTNIISDGFTHSGGPYGALPYTNGAAVNGNKPDAADLPGSNYSYYTTSAGFPGGTIAASAGNPGAAATVGPQSNIVASIKSGAGYAEPTFITLSVDLEMHTLAGSDLLSRGIGLGLVSSVPTGFNAGNPYQNGVIVNAATGNLFFSNSDGSSITAVPGGTYNAALLGAWNPNRFYTLTYSVLVTSGQISNLSLSDSTGIETIASPGTLTGFVTGVGAANSTANFVDVSSNGNDGLAFGYVDNLAVSISAAPTVATVALTTLTSTGATLGGSINAKGSFTTALFQYSTDPTFLPTVSTNIGSGFAQPKGLTVDAAGNVYLANSGGNNIKEILSNNSVAQVGSGFSSPYAIAVDPAGNLYIADFANNAVKEVKFGGAVVTIGSGFSGPGGIAVDALGDVFVADSGHNAIKEILPNGTILTIGSGFNNPQGLAIDKDGDLFVADYGNSVIKEVLPSGTILTLDYGFNAAAGVAVDALGDVFVADTNNNAVKEILPGGTVRTIGSGFSLPIGIAVDAIGNVYVGDYGNNRVVKLSVPTIAATPGSTSGNSAAGISAALTGLSPRTVYYYRAIGQSSGGTVSGSTNGFVTAPAAGSGVAAVTVPTLTLGAGATFAVGSAASMSDRTVLVVNSLSLDVGAQLNLGANDLIVHSIGTATQAQTLADLTALLRTGYNGGAWNGSGIASTAAQNNASHLTALGVKPITVAGTFDGQSVNSSDVVVKYTIYGDADLDGAVDFNDLLILAQQYGHTSTGWSTGDFNYDGMTDFSDLLVLAQHYGSVLAIEPPSVMAVSPARRKQGVASSVLDDPS